ncbi:hypothetical protein, partial [Leucobacter celer]|uniref:hypothetical protein n=1 Tax=Leucobacter celer TaxID=668625 RepID=UPI0012F88159
MKYQSLHCVVGIGRGREGDVKKGRFSRGIRLERGKGPHNRGRQGDRGGNGEDPEKERKRKEEEKEGKKGKGKND